MPQFADLNLAEGCHERAEDAQGTPTQSPCNDGKYAV